MNYVSIIETTIISISLLGCFFVSTKTIKQILLSRSHISIFRREQRKFRQDVNERFVKVESDIRHTLLELKCLLLEKIENNTNNIKTNYDKIEKTQQEIDKNYEIVMKEIKQLQELIKNNAQEINVLSNKIGFNRR